MQKLGLCSAHISIWFAREEKYEIRPKYEIQPIIFSAVKTEVNAGRQTLGASVGGLRSLFSHAGFKALAKDVGSDCNLVGDPNLPLLGCGRCWCGFLLFGGIPTLYWGR